MRKVILTISFLISFISGAFPQVLNPPEVVEIALLRADGLHDIYNTTISEDPVELKTRLIDMIHAFEDVSNLYIAENVGNREKVDTIMTRVLDLKDTTGDLSKTAEDLKTQVAKLAKNQAKFLSVGLDTIVGTTLFSKSYLIGIKPEVRMNLFNTYILGIGIGTNVMGDSLSVTGDLSFGFWLF